MHRPGQENENPVHASVVQLEAFGIRFGSMKNWSLHFVSKTKQEIKP